MTGFHYMETGSHAVNFEIINPSITRPSGVTINGAKIDVMFLLSNHGRTIRYLAYPSRRPRTCTRIDS